MKQLLSQREADRMVEDVNAKNNEDLSELKGSKEISNWSLLVIVLMVIDLGVSCYLLNGQYLISQKFLYGGMILSSVLLLVAFLLWWASHKDIKRLTTSINQRTDTTNYVFSARGIELKVSNPLKDLEHDG